MEADEELLERVRLGGLLGLVRLTEDERNRWRQIKAAEVDAETTERERIIAKVAEQRGVSIEDAAADLWWFERVATSEGRDLQ